MKIHDTGPIVIGCAVDEAFAMPLAAMVHSALAHLESGRAIVLHVVDCGMSAGTRNILSRSLSSSSLTVHWIRPDAARLESLPVWGRMKGATYGRLLMGELLPGSLQKVLWLDCDLIVLGNLADLWETDLRGTVLLAVQDLVVPYVSSRYGVAAYRELGLAPRAKHFNAGVMLVDLSKWRETRVADRAFDYLARYNDRVWFWDQEALNACLSESWGDLDFRWNQIASVAGRPFFSPVHLETKAYRQLVDDPWIIHFAGTLKPWMMRSSPAQKLFFEYLDQTAWKGWRPRPTPRNLIFGLYDFALRRALYRFEHWAIGMQRSIERWRQTTSDSAQSATSKSSYPAPIDDRNHKTKRT